MNLRSPEKSGTLWHRRRRRAGFTLIELVISMSILTLMVVAAGSSITLLFRTVESSRDLMSSGPQGAASAAAQSAAARAAVDMLTADLKVATGILNTPLANGGFQLRLTVPHRYAANPFETLVYQWNGPADGSLTRQLNGNTPALIAQNVQVLNLTMLSRTIGSTLIGGGDPILSGHDGSGNSQNIQQSLLSDQKQICQYVQPVLSPSAASWGITRLQLQLLQPAGGGTGTLNIQVYSADAAQHPLIAPNQPMLTSASIDIATLPGSGSGWTDVALANCSGLTPGSGVCIVLSTTTGNTAAALYDGAVPGSGMVYSTSSDGGATWTTAGTSALQFRLYGPVTTSP